MTSVPPEALRASGIGRKVRYEQLRLEELRAVIRETPVVYVPVGAMEAHGPQNPSGLDGLKAHALCLRAADRFGGVVYPALHVGQQPIALPYAGNVYIRPETARALYRDLLVCLERTGFRVIVLLSGHYPEVPLIRDAAAEVMVNGMTPVLALAETEAAWDVMGSDHGGEWETSLMLALHPELVDMGVLPEDRSIRPPAILGSDARDATAEAGAAAADTAINRIGRLARHLLRERENGSRACALFCQCRQFEIRLEKETRAARRFREYTDHPDFAAYREAFWDGRLEDADAAQQKLVAAFLA